MIYSIKKYIYHHSYYHNHSMIYDRYKIRVFFLDTRLDIIHIIHFFLFFLRYFFLEYNLIGFKITRIIFVFILIMIHFMNGNTVLVHRFMIDYCIHYTVYY